MTKRHPRQSARNDDDFFTEENVRPQIHMPWLDAILQETWCAREFERRLRDVIARISIDSIGEILAFFRTALRTDQHSISARFADRLHYKLVEVIEGMLAVHQVGHQECVYIRKDGIFF